MTGILAIWLNYITPVLSDGGGCYAHYSNNLNMNKLVSISLTDY